MICRQEFVGYYEKALKLVGMRYIDGNCKKVKDNICQRWQRVYFKDLRKSEDQDADQDAARTANNNPIDPAMIDAFTAFMKGMSAIQSKPSATDSIISSVADSTEKQA